jgi:DNA-directed RNA polymerase subunit RPC12/RpoP
MIYRCWRCTRGLEIYRPPKTEDLVVACWRCKAKNVVRADTPTREALDSDLIQVSG